MGTRNLTLAAAHSFPPGVVRKTHLEYYIEKSISYMRQHSAEDWRFQQPRQAELI
jgi:hypothetical protein